MNYNDFIELLPENIAKNLNKEYSSLLSTRALSNEMAHIDFKDSLNRSASFSHKNLSEKLNLLFSLNQTLQNLSYSIGKVSLNKFKAFNCEVLNLIEIVSSEIGKTNLNFENPKKYKNLKVINSACIEIATNLTKLLSFNPDLIKSLLNFLLAWKNFID